MKITISQLWIFSLSVALYYVLWDVNHDYDPGFIAFELVQLLGWTIGVTGLGWLNRREKSS